jgi:hypothetical protein
MYKAFRLVLYLILGTLCHDYGILDEGCRVSIRPRRLGTHGTEDVRLGEVLKGSVRKKLFIFE